MKLILIILSILIVAPIEMLFLLIDIILKTDLLPPLVRLHISLIKKLK